MKKVLITGAAGNLGKAVVDKFLNEGHYVIGVDTVLTGEARKHMEEHAVDASNEEAVSILMKKVIDDHQQVDAALMLIGGFATGSIENSGQAELDKMFTLNFKTAYFFARAAFSQMMKQKNGGKMIFVGSVPAIDDKAGFDMIGYTLSKNAVVKLAKILNSQGHKKNISCAVIAPTTIDTPQNRKSMPDSDFSKWTKAEDIAGFMEFLISEKGDKMKEVIIKM